MHHIFVDEKLINGNTIVLNRNDDEEGIAKDIKQNFSGIPFWRIVGPALDYSERSLSSKAKIPVKSNVDLMKKLAQFWFECKKLDD